MRGNVASHKNPAHRTNYSNIVSRKNGGSMGTGTRTLETCAQELARKKF